jgi:hypothetical protein
MMNSLDALIEVKTLLEEGIHNWTAAAFAHDIDGNRVHPTSEHAVMWDLEGALWKICGSMFSETFKKAHERLVSVVDPQRLDKNKYITIPAGTLAVFNDNHGYEAVIRVLYRAIWDERNARCLAGTDI